MNTKTFSLAVLLTASVFTFACGGDEAMHHGVIRSGNRDAKPIHDAVFRCLQNIGGKRRAQA